MLIIDASAALTWVLPDEFSSQSQNTVLRIAEGSQPAIVPAIWRIEVLNVLLMAERRSRLMHEGVDAALDHLSALPLQVDAALDTRRVAQVRRLARTHNLSAHDATYLELVLRLNGQLFSCDRALVNAARSCGIDCIDTTPGVH